MRPETGRKTLLGDNEKGGENKMRELDTIKGILSIFDERCPDLLREAIEEGLGYTLSGPRIAAREEKGP